MENRIRGLIGKQVTGGAVLKWLPENYKENQKDELLTPLAVRALWNISGASVRKAIGVRNVEVPLELWLTDKPASMIRLESACAFWGEPEKEKVEEMRENGFNLSQGLGWNILHPKPVIVMLVDPEGAGPDELRKRERV